MQNCNSLGMKLSYINSLVCLSSTKISKVAIEATRFIMKKMTEIGSKDKTVHSFEQSIEELESIVAKIENGGSPLNDLIKSYEYGMKLVSSCRKQLQGAECVIREIQQNSQTDDLKP